MDVFATAEWLELRTGRHRTTVNRWRRQRRLPPEVARLALIELEGRLELVHPKWSGWTVNPQTGVLVSPGGDAFTPGEILSVPLHQQRARALELDLERLGTESRGLVARLVDRLSELAGVQRRGRPNDGRR